MGGAVLAGVLKAVNKAKETGTGSDVPISKFIVSVHSKGSADKLRAEYAASSDLVTITQDNMAVFEKSDILMLGFKPYMAEDILKGAGIREAVKGKLVISLLAGSPPSKLEGWIYEGDNESVPQGEIGDRCRVTRCCPNMSAEVGESMTIIEKSTPPLPEKWEFLNSWIFNQCGKTLPVEAAVFDASAAMSGSAIAFMTLAFDGLLDGGVYEGVKRHEGQILLSQMIIGLGRLMQEGQHPATLRENSASPRGTTIRGLLKLEKASVRAAFAEAVIESTARAKGM
jgi:pyrroline-5-carboxylate reductase